MFEADTLEECMVELLPFGSFPTWSMKDINKADLPEFEASQVSINLIVA